MKDQYVILTGSKNNAGDYLIKYRAQKLFENIRPDRTIIDYNGWEELSEEKLATINSSRALILMGGPSLQNKMVPSVYNLPLDINKITVPIITMGIGWMSPNGNWTNTYNYELSSRSIELLKRIEDSGYTSGVRDYHTLNALKFNGFNSFKMTGCPAYYDLPTMHSLDREKNTSVQKIAFSLGVSFVKSKKMEQLMKDNILRLKDKFKHENFEVVFHHSLDKGIYNGVYKGIKNHFQKHLDFSKWLTNNGIHFIDISGSAENLINYYSGVDFHIGYRVHAHIFMSSISKYSLLISEDGRAKGTKDVIGGIVLDSYLKCKDSFIAKGLSQISSLYDRYIPNLNLTKDLVHNIEYEMHTDFYRLNLSYKNIKENFEIMKAFLKQLP
jgi:hypothetical protein